MDGDAPRCIAARPRRRSRIASPPPASSAEDASHDSHFTLGMFSIASAHRVLAVHGEARPDAGDGDPRRPAAARGPDRVVLRPRASTSRTRSSSRPARPRSCRPRSPCSTTWPKVFVENAADRGGPDRGHTDSTGTAAIIRTLSQQRAESVVKYLAGKGVAKGRMVAKGFGPDKPIADNGDDAEPREEPSRRVQHPQAGSEEDHREGRLTMTRLPRSPCSSVLLAALAALQAARAPAWAPRPAPTSRPR